MYRVTKIEAALDNYHKVADFQTYSRKTATEMQTLRDYFRNYIKREEFQEEKQELQFQIKKIDEASAKRADCEQDQQENEYNNAKRKEEIKDLREENVKVNATL